METDGQLLVRDEHDILNARQRARRMATEIGFSGTDLILIATAISEIARNMLDYGKGGEIEFRARSQGQRKGLSIVARDSGPGIADVKLAMEDGYSTGNGLGLGLPGARRLMDEFEIDSTLGVGTTIVMTKWVG